jgi:hypothetical protein
MRRLLLLCLASACGGGDPADVAGTYDVSVTNGDNDCDLANWDVGAQTTDISVEITQNGDTVSAEVTGGAGLVFEAVLGSNVYTGTVDGDHLSLAITGDVAFEMNECDYTFDSEIEADIDGDVITGDIYYRAVTDGDPDCGDLTGCANVQAMNGTRPPS